MMVLLHENPISVWIFSDFSKGDNFATAWSQTMFLDSRTTYSSRSVDSRAFFLLVCHGRVPLSGVNLPTKKRKYLTFRGKLDKSYSSRMLEEFQGDGTGTFTHRFKNYTADGLRIRVFQDQIRNVRKYELTTPQDELEYFQCKHKIEVLKQIIPNPTVSQQSLAEDQNFSTQRLDIDQVVQNSEKIAKKRQK